ncbi:MAG: glycoside hydrolase family 32 protein [Ruminococcus sp.]
MKYRLHFHLMPPAGWLNDPNGLSVFRHEYHVFFQYSPDSPHGGRKFWGHYVSPDLVNWRFLGAPLGPDTEWDRDGVYSGSAFTKDGCLEVFYTGNVKEPGNFDYISAGRGANVLYTKSSNGVDFGEKRLLLSNKDYPSCYTCHVRDPKVWKEKETYYMILGGRRKNNQGAVMLYTSPDKKSWTLLKEISTRQPFGYMWECPDLFQLDGKWFLLCCPQGLDPQEEQYQNLYQSGYFLCDESILEGGGDYFCSPEYFRELDRGFDFYAPQTFVDEKGRRILIGWAGIPEETRYGNDPTVREGWQHCLTVPRQLDFDGHLLRQYPVEELENLRTRKLSLDDKAIEAEAFDLLLTFEGPSQSVTFNEDLRLDCTDGLVSLTFLNQSGDGRTRRCARLIGKDKSIRELRILKDTSLLEIYVNNGELVFTTKYFPEETRRTVVKTAGKVLTSTLWELRRMEVTMDGDEKKYTAGDR